MGTVRIGGIVKSSPSTQFWLEADWVAQEVGNNRSLMRVWLRAANGPAGSTGSSFGGYGIQEAYADGHGRVGWHEGNPFLPGGYGQNAQRWHDHVADRWYGHDANGFGPSVGLSMHLAYGTIDEWHGGSIGAPGRIPKPPGAPVPIGLDQIGPTSMRYMFSGTTDGGSPIREWRIGYGTSPAGPQFYVGSSGTSVVGGLTPATEWFFWSQGRNDYGWGPLSARLSARTLASLYVGKGGAFPAAAAVNVGKAGAFPAIAELRVGRGGSFVTPGS
ncbi:fibronectin type III domain-containing protein [Microbacterium sp. CFH 90308]|uniref:Fibronectin type III domain-containing protein n=1 Tax=Microbacterium salsuginis TaxID=2722803 RepID=A0ABX1KAZ2_9MICO|nr:fibronectin type III domain-containing protein [Microbacterium sp. CFH 90308]NLP82581.1 fibronectin type III domain-containing protein [Microbacterium sp. CFH 90308]